MLRLMGMGLYFFENEGVAKSYKEQFAKPKFYRENLDRSTTIVSRW